MSANFRIEFKKDKGNLHVRPEGDLDGTSAWKLLSLIDDPYEGQGNVFIDTRWLRQRLPVGCATFKCRLGLSPLPSGCLYFQGEKGGGTGARWLPGLPASPGKKKPRVDGKNGTVQKRVDKDSEAF